MGKRQNGKPRNRVQKTKDETAAYQRGCFAFQLNRAVISHAARVRFPDQLMQLRLLTHGQAIFEDPLGERARIESRATKNLKALLLRKCWAEMHRFAARRKPSPPRA